MKAAPPSHPQDLLNDKRLLALTADLLSVGVDYQLAKSSLVFRFSLPSGRRVTIGYIDLQLRLLTDTVCRPSYKVSPAHLKLCRDYLEGLAGAFELEVYQHNSEITSLKCSGKTPSIADLWDRLQLWPPIACDFRTKMWELYLKTGY
jgi:hypothetical protein